MKFIYYDIKQLMRLNGIDISVRLVNVIEQMLFLFVFSEILNNLCEKFLRKNVSAIIYLTNYEMFGRSTASSQYFLQLASYLGIPVIA